MQHCSNAEASDMHVPRKRFLMSDELKEQCNFLKTIRTGSTPHAKMCHCGVSNALTRRWMSRDHMVRQKLATNARCVAITHCVRWGKQCSNKTWVQRRRRRRRRCHRHRRRRHRQSHCRRRRRRRHRERRRRQPWTQVRCVATTQLAQYITSPHPRLYSSKKQQPEVDDTSWQPTKCTLATDRCSKPFEIEQTSSNQGFCVRETEKPRKCTLNTKQFQPNSSTQSKHSQTIFSCLCKRKVNEVQSVQGLVFKYTSSNHEQRFQTMVVVSVQPKTHEVHIGQAVVFT